MEPENTTKKKRNKNHILARKNKTDSRKIVNKLTYNPAKHKQKWTKKSRLLLQQKVIPTHRTVTPSTTIKFGSFNVNGLDLEAAWAVEELLKKRGFDVKIKSENSTKNNS
jgi:hypothetical protein